MMPDFARGVRETWNSFAQLPEKQFVEAIEALVASQPEVSGYLGAALEDESLETRLAALSAVLAMDRAYEQMLGRMPAAIDPSVMEAADDDAWRAVEESAAKDDPNSALENMLSQRDLAAPEILLEVVLLILEGVETEREFAERFSTLLPPLKAVALAYERSCGLDQTEEKASLGELLDRRPAPARRLIKVGRNKPCPCGSGRKLKKCCGAAAS